MSTRFLQIHTLTSYPGALLNRDDAGFAKRLPFGGAVRTRVSSQCLKRHWRVFDGEGALSELDIPPTYRSRVTFERLVVQPLLKEGHPEAAARAVADALQAAVLGKSEKAKAKEKKGAEKEAEPKAATAVETNQVTVLGKPEIDYLLSLARQALAAGGKDPAATVGELLGKEGKKTLLAMANAGGLGAALFGRMVTSDLLARGDASVHVAHAFTVHAQEAETDYFSAVDDLLRSDGELGSGHIGNVELTSGLYYGYVVVDVPLLVKNLTGSDAGDPALAGRVVERLIRIIATVSPGAKLGSTAPYSFARMVLVEAGRRQPRTLANAFQRPVPRGGDLTQAAYAQLGEELAGIDRMYGPHEERRVCGIALPGSVGERLGASVADNLPALAAWAGAKVAGA